MLAFLFFAGLVLAFLLGQRFPARGDDLQYIAAAYDERQAQMIAKALGIGAADAPPPATDLRG